MMSPSDNGGITGRKRAAKKAERGHCGIVKNSNVNATDHRRRIGDDLDYRQSVRQENTNPAEIPQRARLLALQGACGQGRRGRTGCKFKIERLKEQIRAESESAGELRKRGQSRRPQQSAGLRRRR